MLSFPLLGCCRSWAVLCLFSSLSLLVPPQPAQAQGYPGGGSGGGYPGASAYIGEGSYIGSAYSGGTVTTTRSSSGYSLNLAGIYGGEYYASGGSNSNNSVTCAGEIKRTYTWSNTDPNLLPPHCVIVVEHCIAQWHGSASGGGTLTGGCANPLGGSPVLDVPDPGATWEFTKYTVQSGTAPDSPLPTVSVSCSPEADAECANGGGPNPISNGTASVKYTAGPIIPPQLQAHSTVDTNGTPDAGGNYTHPWDPFHPRFFSGTNCSVGGTATAYRTPPGSYPAGGTYVMQATLSIGGTVVKSYYDTSFIGPVSPDAARGTNQRSVPLSAFFDSTHFADGSPISAQMTVTDSGGLTYTVSVQANAYNKAYVLSNASLTSDFSLIASTASGMHHTPNGSGSISDTKLTILSQIPTYTALYICTHGGSTGLAPDGTTKPGRFFDCTYRYPDLDVTDTHRVYATNVLTAIQNKSVNQPPYNFVFVDGCSTAADNTLANAFFPSMPGSDQAYLSFTTEVGDSIHNATWSNAIWTGMSNGKTITDAITYANTTVGKPDINTDNPDGAAQYKTIGDSSMKLHGVYGFPDLGTAWYY